MTAVRTLLLLRHAKSSWRDPGRADHDRPLNARGKRDAPRMGALLRDEGLVPDDVVASTARRARRTAEKACAACGFEGPIELDEDLYLAAPEAIATVVRARDDAARRLLVVGHNPGLEEFLEALTGEPERVPTAALAAVALDLASWRDLDLDGARWPSRIWRPRELA